MFLCKIILFFILFSGMSMVSSGFWERFFRSSCSSETLMTSSTIPRLPLSLCFPSEEDSRGQKIIQNYCCWILCTRVTLRTTLKSQLGSYSLVIAQSQKLVSFQCSTELSTGCHFSFRWFAGCFICLGNSATCITWEPICCVETSKCGSSLTLTSVHLWI